MKKEEVVSGKNMAWTIKEKLGEGDAGEVYRVESLIERKTAVIKRPGRNAFTSDVVRQAAQIDREAQILRALAQHKFSSLPISTPKWLDQSPVSDEFSDRFFIIITEAKGLNLAALARCIRFGAIHPEEKHLLAPTGLTIFEEAYVASLIAANRIPDLVILRILESLLSFLEHLHAIENQSGDLTYHGIIWNDVKIDHVFYQPKNGHITIIDWGNSHFLEASGSTPDKQHSKLDDLKQFIIEMGNFLMDASPDLFSALQWPEADLSGISISEKMSTLKGRIKNQLTLVARNLALARQREKDLLASQLYRYEDYLNLKQVQQELHFLGEIPDIESTKNFSVKIAQELIKAGEIEKFSSLCEQLSIDNAHDAKKWQLLARISALLSEEPSLKASLHYALKEEWSNALWELRSSIRYEPAPEWWNDLCALIRELGLNGGNQSITPRTALNRLVLSIQSALQNELEPEVNHAGSQEKVNEKTENTPIDIAVRRSKLIQTLRAEAINPWAELEPAPPNSDIGYQEVLKYTQEILELEPAAGQSLIKAMEQPLAKVQLILDAWEKQDFETARRGLRQLLMWDPDRKRLIGADTAIRTASSWLARLRQGPEKDEALHDFVTRLELKGREIRNQVGPAIWLDSTLSTLRNLRKGGEPTEILLQFPSSRPYLSWLLELDDQPQILSAPDKQYQLQRISSPDPVELGLRGVFMTGFGTGQDIELEKPLDTWAPEASGSSARVFLADIKSTQRSRVQSAIKIMRPDKVDYALPLFREEVQVLSMLRNVPGVAQMLEVGFLQPADHNAFLVDDYPLQEMQGQAIRYALDSTHNFLMELEKQTRSGLLPYLIIETQEQKKNLLTLCDTGYTHGHFLPVLEGLVLAIQICEVLEAAHQRNISYRDHKILHYYWDEASNGVAIIDWNIAKHYPTGLSAEDARFDLVQFGARTLHHILTGRTAPGALPLGPTRPDEIETAARTYQVKWTYDDKRLPKSIKDLLEKVLTGGYDNPRSLRDDLTNIFHQLYELTRQENQSEQSPLEKEELR